MDRLDWHGMLGIMSKPRFQIINCATAGIEAVDATTSQTLKRHFHEEFGIGAMRVGGHLSHSGRGQVEAGRGDAITVNPGEVHDGVPLHAAERSWCMLYIDPVIMKVAVDDVFDLAAGRFEWTRPVISDCRTTDAFWAYYRAEISKTEAAEREEKLLILTASAGDISDQADTDPPAPVAISRQRIDDDPAAPVTLAELAELGGISRFRLIRSFAKTTGLTPHAYLIQRRTEKARNMVRAGLSLAEAAMLAGFADQSHMTRAFVARYGISPGAYKAALQ